MHLESAGRAALYLSRTARHSSTALCHAEENTINTRRKIMQPATNCKFAMSWGDLYDAVKILKPFSNEFNANYSLRLGRGALTRLD